MKHLTLILLLLPFMGFSQVGYIENPILKTYINGNEEILLVESDSLGNRYKVLTSQLNNINNVKSIIPMPSYLAKLNSGTYNIIQLGDSNTENSPVSKDIIDIHLDKVEFGGVGYIDFARGNIGTGPYSSVANGFTFSNSGQSPIMTEATASTTANFNLSISALLPNYGINNDIVKFNKLTILYKNTGGAFSYKIDGGTPVNVITGTDGLQGEIVINGLTDESHVVEIEWVSGTITMYGLILKRTSGGTFHMVGRGGIKASDYVSGSDIWKQNIKEIDPDLVIVALGNNDFATPGYTTSKLISDIDIIINNIKSIKANVDILILIGSQRDDIPYLQYTTDYRNAAIINAKEKGYSYFSLWDYFKTHQEALDAGIKNDIVHYTPLGGMIIQKELINLLLTHNDNEVFNYAYKGVSIDRRLGIGIDAPLDLFHVKNGDIRIENSETGTTSNPVNSSLKFMYGSNNVAEIKSIQRYANSGHGGLSFHTNNGTSIERMRLDDADGNLLIGTAINTHSNKLVVNGSGFINGSVKISDSATAPTPGTIRYNTGTDKFQGFTSGSGWVDLH